MLKKAFNKIPDNTNLILHSDQGWQYQMKQYQAMLVDKGIRQSMSRKGNGGRLFRRDKGPALHHRRGLREIGRAHV